MLKSEFLKNKFNISLISAILLIVLVGVFTNQQLFKCKAIECLVFQGKDVWNLNEVYVNDKDTWKGTFTANSGQIIKIEKTYNTSKEDATQLTNIRLMQTKGLFEKAASPYPGAVSDSIVCDDKFMPSEKRLNSITGTEIVYFKEYLNNRMAIGTCIENQVAYIGYLINFYCRETREWYQLELINTKESEQSEDQLRNILSKAGCQRPSLNIGKLLP